MLVEIDSDLTVAEVQRMAALVGRKVYARPDGGLVIRKPHTQENTPCRSKNSSPA